MKQKTKLTILTATYNRRDLLERLANSIFSQITCSNQASWIVVDDGSTDKTDEFLQTLKSQHESLFSYLRLKNGGKCRAIDCALKEAKSEWIVVIDSDDYLLPNSLSKLLEVIDNTKDKSIGMIAALLRINGVSRKIFQPQANPDWYWNWVSQQGLFDFVPVMRLDLAQRHPYPLHDGEKYMAEGWRYEKISETHKTLFFNEEIVCAEYLPDGLSASSLSIRIKSPLNALQVYANQINSPYCLKLKIRAQINYWRFYFHAKVQGKKPRPNPQALLIFSTIGKIFYMRDMIRINNGHR